MDEKILMVEELYLVSETETTEKENTSVAESEVELVVDLPLEVEEPPKKISRVNEIAELRGKNSKVSRMSDGSQQEVFYPNALHVYDEET